MLYDEVLNESMCRKFIFYRNAGHIQRGRRSLMDQNDRKSAVMQLYQIIICKSVCEHEQSIRIMAPDRRRDRTATVGMICRDQKVVTMLAHDLLDPGHKRSKKIVV